MAEATEWTNPSVRAFAGENDPIDVIVRRARELALQAMDEGWTGPPFDPFVLADRLGVTVVAQDELHDARTVPIGEGRVRIEFNPNRPRGRLRFSIAHELAHTFFSDVADETRYRAPVARDADDAWQLELLCNIAAAELLMPIGTFVDLERAPLDINSLMRIRREFDVSTEALLRRVVQLTDSPALFFAASREKEQDFGSFFRIDYSEPSSAWSLRKFARGHQIPKETVLRHCAAVGFTDSAVETWDASIGPLRIECVGVGAYPGHRFPRVVGLALPGDLSASATEAIHYVDGDATAPRGEGRKFIFHIVNDVTANWGGNFAKALARKYPVVQDDFRQWVDEDRSRLQLGRFHLADVGADTAVVTLIAQKGYGANRKQRVSYMALAQCLNGAVEVALQESASAHMPKIGTGMAGGRWAIIRELIERTLVAAGIEVTVYSPPGYEAPIDLQESFNLEL